MFLYFVFERLAIFLTSIILIFTNLSFELELFIIVTLNRLLHPPAGRAGFHISFTLAYIFLIAFVPSFLKRKVLFQKQLAHELVKLFPK